MSADLVVAFDIPSAAVIHGILNQLPDEIAWFKVGLELFTADGPSALNMLKQSNKKIFLDLKLHDIPNTVGRTVSAMARLNISMITIHASGGRAMMQAAADAAKKCEADAPKLVAVTTLTSLNQTDLADIGVRRDLTEQALALSELALSSGMDGLVCSAHEAASLRKKIGPSPLLVTPGIRSFGFAPGDQKRVATPAMAVEAGSDFLVVGRPILNAADPCAAACAILKEMNASKL